MGSVWKRIQRVGKRASKFQFIASYQTLMLECSRDGKWQPNKLSVIWTRRSKRKAVKSETWQPSIANPFRGMIVWTDPPEIEITVTLYKDAREGSPFEDKLWTFVIEDESMSGKRRPVASVAVNMADYHSIDLQTFCLTLPLRPATKKVVSASLELNLACVLLKEGNAMDEDMISMSSLMSLNDPYGSGDFDNSGKHFKRNTHKRLSLRSGKAKNKPTFNLASPNTGSLKPLKGSGKSRGKTPTREMLNSSLPVEGPPVNGLKKPLSTSDPDLSKIEKGNRHPMMNKDSTSAAEKDLLKWCQECIAEYKDISVSNMTTSWRNGLAFCAIIHHFNPDMIDLSKLKPDDVRENNRLAFEAFDYLGIPRILDPHQMVLASVPDKLLIMTYLHQIKQHFTSAPPQVAEEDDSGFNEFTLAAISEVGKKLTQISENTLSDFNTGSNVSESRDVACNERTTKELETSSSETNELHYESKPGYNPFEEEVVDETVSRDNGGIVEQSNDLRTDKMENKLLEKEQLKTEDKFENDHLKSEELRTTLNVEETEHAEVRVSSESKSEGKKVPSKLDLSESKASPPATTTTTTEESLVYSPQPGYNPFLDEEDVIGVEDKKDPSKEEEPLNPFDDDYEEKLLQQSVQPVAGRLDQPVAGRLDQPVAGRLDQPVAGRLDQPVAGRLDQPKQGQVAQVDETKQQSDQEDARKMKPSLNPFDDDYEDEIPQTNIPDTNKIVNKHHKRAAPQSPANITTSSAARSPRPGTSTIPARPERPKPPADKRANRNLPTRPLNKPEPLGLAQSRSNSASGRSSGRQSPACAEPTSPRKNMPSFQEWKALKSSDTAKQEQRKAHAIQLIKEARAKNAKSQAPIENNTANVSSDAKKLSPATNRVVASSLPRFATSPKKYRAPEPPSSQGNKQPGNLASKLQEEIEYQKKITEKTRRTLESSRIKRINPKQENPSVVDEARSERSEKVQQAIEDARGNMSRKPKASDAEKPGDENAPELSSTGPSMLSSPPKPPRAFTYTDDVSSSDVHSTSENDSGDVDDQTDSGIALDSIDATSVEDANASSLQQNPFKLTIKRKEAIPQAVVKPMTAAPIGKETKIDLKKYSVRSRSNRKLNTARVDELSDGQRKHRKAERTQSSEHNETPERNVYSRHLCRRKDSLSDGHPSSEEDVNDILDNIGSSPLDGNKTDEESLHYDNADEEDVFQDTSQYVEHEIATLEEDRVALDRVAVKLEKELREAMNTADCKEDEHRLFQEWFHLVNKRNEIVRRQTELSILEKEEDLEKRFELLNRELRFLMSDNSREKTPQEQKREELLLSELVRLVNKRDELVRIEDTQVQEAEKAAEHVEHVVRNTRIPKKQSDCSIQ